MNKRDFWRYGQTNWNQRQQQQLFGLQNRNFVVENKIEKDLKNQKDFFTETGAINTKKICKQFSGFFYFHKNPS